MRHATAYFRQFFKSWYVNNSRLLIFAAISTFLVLCCMPDLARLQHGSLYRQWHMWAITFILMVPMVYGIAFVVFYLSRSALFQANGILRWIVQFLLLCIALPLLTWQTLCTVYLLCYNVDLYELDYMELDFAILLVCFVSIQVYYKMAADRRAIRAVRQEVGQLNKHINTLVSARLALQNRLGDLKTKIQEHKQQIRHGQQELSKFVALLAAYQDTIRIRFDKQDFESVPVVQLESVFLDKIYAGAKIVHARLLSGKCGIVDADSLNNVLQVLPHSLLRLKRDLLISRFAVRAVYSTDGCYYIQIYGENGSTISINFEIYQNIVGFRERCAGREKGGGDVGDETSPVPQSN